MKTSPSIDILLALAGNEAAYARFDHIEPEHLLLALLKLVDLAAQPLPFPPLTKALLAIETAKLKELLKARNIDATRFRRRLRTEMGHGERSTEPTGRPHRSDAAKAVFTRALLRVAAHPRASFDSAHLLQELLDHPPPRVAGLLGPGPASAATDTPRTPALPPGFAGLTQRLEQLHDRLREQVFGQDEAIHAFVEALFNAELLADADRDRRSPRAFFVFAGPPGVGKTLLAESGATSLERPFRRFDMSSYGDSGTVSDLVGTAPAYKGAQPGRLTGFVQQHPDAILLFDEVEKAHRGIIHLFLQILDAGVLEDKFESANVAFRDTLIIFTSNAGRLLYDRPNQAGVGAVNARYHRRTVLDALKNEIDPTTRQPFFPAAICSRMAAGYPVLFRHLGVSDLERIAAAELDRQDALLQRQYAKHIEYGELLPLALVMREGPSSDARSLRAQVEAFVKTELYQWSRLFSADKRDAMFARAQRFVFDLDANAELPEALQELIELPARPAILLISGQALHDCWQTQLGMFDWHWADTLGDALLLLERHRITLVILDLWLGQPDRAAVGTRADVQAGAPVDQTRLEFDHVPQAAHVLAKGRSMLQGLHQHYPGLACYLLAGPRSPIDENLLYACSLAGGARGAIETGFVDSDHDHWEQHKDQLIIDLIDKVQEVHRQDCANRLLKERKMLVFDSAPLATDPESVQFRLRNLRLTTAVTAVDVGDVLLEVDKPDTRFAQVIGADAAKEELQHIVAWLRNPHQFRAIGIDRPRGILLYGVPGTGKTLLARALAGESNAAFLVASATDFVTKWVGSGPENIRKLFQQARRYAPAIIFIDEIDAIGRHRGGDGGGGVRAVEETLNALLTEMDGFGSATTEPVIVLAATNRVDELDPALRRRFDRDVEVEPPDRAARRRYLQQRIADKPRWSVSDTVIDRMAGQSANLTLADLERILDMAARMAARTAGVDPGAVDDALLEEAFERIRMGETKGETDPETLLRVARHEAGHCLIGWLGGEKPVQISIVARGRAGGFVERDSDEHKMLLSKPAIEARIRQAMGGRAAEVVYDGREAGMSSGVASDLRAATGYAEAMVRDYGMSPLGQVALDPRRLSDGPVALEVVRAVEATIAVEFDRAVAEIESHRGSIDRLVEALLEKNRLTREDLDRILPVVAADAPPTDTG